MILNLNVIYKGHSKIHNSYFIRNFCNYAKERVIHATREVQSSVETFNSFAREFNNKRIELSPVQKFILVIGSSVVCSYNPRRVDMLACCAETLSSKHLKNILDQMKANELGKEILRDKPTIVTHVDKNYLLQLAPNTFGWGYGMFLQKNNVTADNKIPVRFINDLQLAYVLTRCRQVHDYLHVVLNIPTNKVGEIALKWVEALNFGLPIAYVAAILGSLYLSPKDRTKYLREYLPLAIANGQNHNKYFLLYWEKMWEEDLNVVRKRLQMTAFV